MGNGTPGYPDSSYPMFRREIDLLRDELRELSRRLSDIDLNGTRGSGELKIKVEELRIDLTELRTEFKQRERDHVTGRRWMIGTVATMLGTMLAVLTLLVTIFQHVHK